MLVNLLTVVASEITVSVIRRAVFCYEYANNQGAGELSTQGNIHEFISLQTNIGAAYERLFSLKLFF